MNDVRDPLASSQLDGNLFTPRLEDGTRAEMRLSDEDQAKCSRGRNWSAEVTDLLTGKRWKVRGASCGSPRCFCDAIAEPLDQSESVPGFHVPIMAEDLDGLSDAGRDGFNAFCSDVGLHRNPNESAITRHNWENGWNMAYTRCFAVGAVQGYHDRLLDREGCNPYPQFSTAWEAWAAGHDTAGPIIEVLR